MKANWRASFEHGWQILPTYGTIFDVFALLFVLLAISGGTLRSADYTSVTVPPSNAPLGRIALAYGGPLPEFDLQIPDTTGETVPDTSVRWGLSWARDLHDNAVRNELEALGIYVRMAFTPLGMMAGAAYGSVAGESGKKLDNSVTLLTNAMTVLQVQESPRRRLLLLIQQSSPQPLRILTNSFPAETAFRVPTEMDRHAPLPFYASDQQLENECTPSAFDGVDTLMLLRVINHGLSGPHGHNSKLTLNMALRVTLVKTRDRTQLAGFYAQYDSPPRRFVDWALGNAQPLRDEFELGIRSLAQQIVAQGGLLRPPIPEPNGFAQASVNPEQTAPIAETRQSK